MTKYIQKLPAPKYQLIGHRGVAGLRPENTLCSFAYAAELGLNWIEFDVQLTKDGTWVVIHDETLDRTTNGHGLVAAQTVAEISTLAAGLWHTPPYPEERIPTLLATLQQTAKLKTYCNVEIKGADADPRLLARAMLQFIELHPALVQPRVIVSSFILPVLVYLREQRISLPLSMLVDNFTPDTIAIAKQYNLASINCDVERITVADLVAAKAANIPVLLYTINDKAAATFWLNEGVAAIFTDRADLLR